MKAEGNLLFEGQHTTILDGFCSLFGVAIMEYSPSMSFLTDANSALPALFHETENTVVGSVETFASHA